MREDPQPEKPESQKMFAGDNFVRQTGEVSGFNSLNLFSVTSYEKGHNVHLQVGGRTRSPVLPAAALLLLWDARVCVAPLGVWCGWWALHPG